VRIKPALHALLLLVVVLLAACQPPILRAGWRSPEGKVVKELPLTAAAGTPTTAQVRFLPGDNESSGLDLRLEGTYKDWVKTDPPRLSNVEAGVAIPLTLHVSVPAGTPPGDYEVHLAVLTGEKQLSELPLRIEVP
jgi:uncharacterized membrane protein